MSWGSSWGSSNAAVAGGTWGTSSWSSSSHGSKDFGPEGQHYNQCIAGNTWGGKNGILGGCYDENCPGCRHDRAGSTWSSSSSGGNAALKLATLFGVGVLAKKSLWD